MSCAVTVRVGTDDFDVSAEIAALTMERTDLGAVVTFTGVCRDEGGRLAALELEHYPGMAEAEIGRAAAEAAQRWPLGGLTAIHRCGRLPPGANIVLVVTASRHRAAAFEAAQFMMDYLKTRAPFWKKEHLTDGSSGDWVAAADRDAEAAGSWAEDTPAGQR